MTEQRQAIILNTGKSEIPAAELAMLDGLSSITMDLGSEKSKYPQIHDVGIHPILPIPGKFHVTRGRRFHTAPLFVKRSANPTMRGVHPTKRLR